MTGGLDWKVFEKTPEEKVELSNAKATHKQVLRAHYGKDWKKHHNVPQQ